MLFMFHILKRIQRLKRPQKCQYHGKNTSRCIQSQTDAQLPRKPEQHEGIFRWMKHQQKSKRLCDQHNDLYIKGHYISLPKRQKRNEDAAGHRQQNCDHHHICVHFISSYSFQILPDFQADTGPAGEDKSFPFKARFRSATDNLRSKFSVIC